MAEHSHESPPSGGGYGRRVLWGFVLVAPYFLLFVLIMTGFLAQWPTLVTLAMFPVLAPMYARLARREEAEMLARFGEEYARDRKAMPAFLPRLGMQGDANGG